MNDDHLARLFVYATGIPVGVLLVSAWRRWSGMNAEERTPLPRKLLLLLSLSALSLAVLGFLLFVDVLVVFLPERYTDVAALAFGLSTVGAVLGAFCPQPARVRLVLVGLAATSLWFVVGVFA